jgi:hypothetical protein
MKQNTCGVSCLTTFFVRFATPRQGYDKYGFNRQAFDKDGFDVAGFDK